MSERYNYVVKLEIANDKRRGDFDLTVIKKEIEEAIEQYNSLNTVRDKKHLSCIVHTKMLEFMIKSPNQLDIPSKALAKFTRILLELSPTLRETVVNRRVFKSLQTSIPASSLDCQYSSCETLKRVIEIFCGEEITDEHVELQRKIKKIIYNVEES